ncbi:hypothetical protein NHP190012_07070 [Helicobacter sp. NHP19-012]|uniref:Uncharacterized protein n=1 Tax=Helicobacter gastrofelis TaxID=2849642 RepID=A0ABM7SN99_9HELI|nr:MULTISPECIES: hypothetical protein [unclassified Helicobacter]BCZ19065.1 hypothetical protein NHP190012_07070 [Helicobacter sp. NHP19-012]GMB96584.1 hypothetical protein NHP22001_11730 [Helicobacter sp. NHP22-001]
MERGKPKHDVYGYQGNVITKDTGKKRIEPRIYAQLMEKEKGARQKWLIILFSLLLGSVDSLNFMVR